MVNLPADTPHSHLAFGLKINSALRLPELLSSNSDAPPDVTIEFGTVAVDLPDGVASGVRFAAAPGRLLLRVDGVARYLITEGKHIRIDPDPTTDETDIRVFLLGSAFGALLHQRRDLVLHGSAIDWEGEAVVFLVISGMGKSTTANAFRKRGHAVLTDDLCVVRAGPDGRMQAYPGFPQSKLWLDSLQKLDFSAEGLARIRHKIEKRAVPLGADFSTSPLPLKKLYHLGAHNEDGFLLLPSAGPQKFHLLKQNTYRFGYLAGVEGKIGHFQQVIQLAHQVPLVIAIRPRDGFKLDQFVSTLEADLRQ